MTKFAHVILFSSAVLGSIFPASAQERREVPEFRVFPSKPRCSEAPASTVERFIEKYRQAWGQEDVDTFMSLHAPDTEWINAYARMFRGADNLKGFLRDRLFQAFSPEVSKGEAEAMKLISIRHLSESDAAVVHLYSDGRRGPSRNAGEEARRTHFHLVLEKSGCDWKVVHTAIMDART